MSVQQRIVLSIYGGLLFPFVPRSPLGAEFVGRLYETIFFR